MIVAIDIGNTNTGIALLKEKKVKVCVFVKTGFRGCYEKRLSKALRTLLKDTKTLGHQDTGKVEDVVVCSVSPKALTIAKTCVKKVFKMTPKVIGKDILVPIKNMYDDPAQVGQDRLICAHAASQIYGAPCVVVDLGTAITFDVVSGKGAYLGGIIAPGIRLSAQTLFEHTALLPKIEVHKPKQLIGKNTEESILSGMFYGYGEMIKGIIDLLTKQLHGTPQIVVTGGYADVMKNYVPEYKCQVDKDLVYKGIALSL